MAKTHDSFLSETPAYLCGLVGLPSSDMGSLWLETISAKDHPLRKLICFCGYSFGDGSAVDTVKAKQDELREVETLVRC